MEIETLSSDASEARFAAYVDGLAEVLGHADRVEPFRDYCMGLLLPGERKSVEPIAAVVAPGRTAAKHQSLLNFVGESPWSDQALLAKVRELVLPAIEAQGKIEAWIVDDTGFVKKGVHSVGVARQYCGRLGKTDNCQVAVSLSIANPSASLPIAYRLYLPEDWTNDAARREKARVPDHVDFQTKPQIALAQIEAAIDARVPRGVVLGDAGYGSDGAFRAGVTALGLLYAVGVQSTISLWPPGMEPLPPEPWSGRGRKPTRLRRDDDHQPVSAKTLAMGLPKEGLANRVLARGLQRYAVLALRRHPGATGLWRRKALDPATVRMVSRRMARGRGGADEILALDPARGDIDRSSRRHGQIALAHRTRLRGTEERTRPRALRGPGLARLPPSRHALHRRAWIPDPRESGPSPLWTPATQRTSPFRSSSTPRRPRSDPSDTSRTRSRPCEND
jgi:DDE superfamily endonuclease